MVSCWAPFTPVSPRGFRWSGGVEHHQYAARLVHILGGYLTYFAWHYLGINPIVIMPVIAALLFALGYGLQHGLVNKVVTAPVLTTLR